MYQNKKEWLAELKEAGVPVEEEFWQEMGEWIEQVTFRSQATWHEVELIYTVCSNLDMDALTVANMLNDIRGLRRKIHPSLYPHITLRMYLCRMVNAGAKAERNRKENKRFWNRFKKLFRLYKLKPEAVKIEPAVRCPQEVIDKLSKYAHVYLR